MITHTLGAGQYTGHVGGNLKSSWYVSEACADVKSPTEYMACDRTLDD